jgi:hypothetical protein
MMLKDFHQRALDRFAFDDEAIGLEQARIILGQVHAAAPTEISPRGWHGRHKEELDPRSHNHHFQRLIAKTCATGDYVGHRKPLTLGVASCQG